MGERLVLTVRADDAGGRLDRFLAAEEAIVSRSFAQRLIGSGSVLVNGRVAAKNHIVRAGERVEVFLPDAEPSELEPEEIPLDVRYEDEHVIVLSKPAGLVVHPARGHKTGTLVHALLAHADELGTLAGDDRPGIVHRLDKDTSGLMMVAKRDEAHAALAEALKIRSVERRYAALVHGYIAPDTGIIDAPIGRHPKDRLRMAVVDSEGSKQAVTTFTVLERFEAGTHDDGYTLIECKLYTGRTHQIRVHMQYVHHPCVGDPLYGKRHPKADLGLTRQFLHAYRLSFTHPATGETLEFVDPLPEDLKAAYRGIADRSMGVTAEGERALEALGLR